MMENPIKIDDLGVPLFLETPTRPHTHTHTHTHTHESWESWHTNKNLTRDFPAESNHSSLVLGWF